MVCLPMKRSRDQDALTSMANYLMILSRGTTSTESYDVNTVNRVFECKTCNRQFPSFQALGGHRASHKKPRLDGDMTGHHDAIVLGKPNRAEPFCNAESRLPRTSARSTRTQNRYKAA